MNRRGFLGFFGAGTLAAPKLAADIAQQAAAPPTPPIGFPSSTECFADDTSWKVSRIKELKRIISGGTPEEKHLEKMSRLYALEVQDRARLDSLRSVTPVNKHRMLINGQVARERRIRAACAKWDLKQLLSGA